MSESMNDISSANVVELPPVAGRWSGGYLWAECLLLFGGLPLILALLRGTDWFRMAVIPTLLIAGGACLVWLILDRRFETRQLWNTERFFPRLWAVLGMGVVAFAVVSLGVWFWSPEELYRFPRERPMIWLIVMLFYPLLSVYPQEVICRSFLFHRYRRIAGDGLGMIILSAVVFAWIHIVFLSWVTLLLSLVAGVLIAYRYWRTRSLLLACIEHALYGQIAFTAGLGQFFYANHQAAQAAGAG